MTRNLQSFGLVDLIVCRGWSPEQTRLRKWVGPVWAGWSGPVAPDDSHGWVGLWPAWLGRGGVGRQAEGSSVLEGSPGVSRPWLLEISEVCWRR